MEHDNQEVTDEVHGESNGGGHGDMTDHAALAPRGHGADDSRDDAERASPAEFPDDPGVGFGFADADELAAEQAADEGDVNDGDVNDGATPDLTPEEIREQEEADAEARADAEEAAAAYARASMRDFDTPPEPVEVDADDPLVAHRGDKPKQLVIVNDVPGDETRIAILEQGKLMQFYSERAATSTNVGSIYKARVVNVEPAIQAAFVDFGEGANGFLHISDLHPKYFPGNRGDSEKSVEKVGKKIPRRARPLIQDALKRGMEITVQVLKEGLGSKGPTVTSYLSIPGRLLVMMPDMDNVGVSRKVDDEEGRRKMRKILDSLNLPEGFGFILRTAGFDATRTELARDAQYLTRLWQVMDRRMDAVGAPCQLYTEGDILLRTIRDSIDATVDGIVCDSESSFHRAKAFLEVVSPRTAAKVHFWDRRMPIFHAFDVERQVDLIHAREVPLPSGGALVIDQTEALVAIDVNSGRSRSARDSETNAYQTNQEAVDEIARQLRLRDLGGVIVNDLIDMRSFKHRREIEDRLKKHFQKDRAKTTVSQISEFGIVEMTRQRMRPSLRKTHYMECPHCQGLGEIRMPDTVAADAVRRIQYILDMAQVARIEVVCSAKVAAVMLSRKRRTLVELEDLFSKKIEVRISEAISVDRVDLYAYDERGADVELDKPQRLPMPSLANLPTEIGEDEAAPVATESRGDGQSGGGRRRRRRRRKPAAADATSMILSGGFEDLPDIDEDEPSMSDAIDAQEAEDERSAAEDAEERDTDDSAEAGADGERREDGEGGRRRRRRRRRRGGRGGESARGDHGGDHGGDHAGADDEAEQDGTSRRAAPAPAAKPVAPPPPPREPSDPIRVHAIAKEMELTSKEVLAKCAELGIEVKGHQSLLSGEQGDNLRKAYGKPPFDVPEPEPEPESSASSNDGGDGEGEGGRKRRRRRRRRGRGNRGDDAAGDAGAEFGPSGSSEDGGSDDASDDADADAAETSDADATDSDDSDDGATDDGATDDGSSQDESSDGGSRTDGGGEGRRRKRRRRGGRGRRREDRGAERAGDRVDSAGARADRNSDGDRDAQNRGGNDRGGADRGGKDTGGKDTGGKDRSGSERGGSERGGQNRDGQNRDGQNRDGQNRDGKDRGGKDRGGKERGGKERSGRDRGGKDRGENRDRGGDNRREPRAESPKPPAPAPAPAPAAKPRSLYGGRVRKLAPGERPKGGGDE